MANVMVGGVSRQGEYGYETGTGAVDRNPEHAADEAGAGGSMTPGESDARAVSAQAGGDLAAQHMERGIAEPYGVAGPDEGGDMEGRLYPTEHSQPTREDIARHGPGAIMHTGHDVLSGQH